MKITLPFDEIYVLHLAKSTKRLNIIQNLKNIFTNNIIVRENTNIPFEMEICNFMLSKLSDDLFNSEYCRRQTVFNTTLNHYLTIKQAYERGLNTILIFEDDIIFNTNFDFSEYFNINNFPKDWSILRWTCHFFDKLKKHSVKYNNYFVKHISQNKTMFGNIACYALNRDGMKHYINYIDNNGYVPADFPMMFYDFNSIHQYFANTINICCGVSDNLNNVNYINEFIPTLI